MAALALLTKHLVDSSILCCVHSANAPHPLRIYRFLRDEGGARFPQFIPIVEKEPRRNRRYRPTTSRRSVNGKKFGQFLIAVFDECIRRDVGTVSVQMFDVALSAWLGEEPGLCVFEPTCGQALAMEHSGDVYSCDHFVDPRHLLGNMMKTPLAELAASPQQRRFSLQRKLGHSSLTMTDRCVHLASDQAAAQDRVAPMDKLDVKPMRAPKKQ